MYKESFLLGLLQKIYDFKMIENYYCYILKKSGLVFNRILTQSVKFLFCENHFIPRPFKNKAQISSRIWLFLFVKTKEKILLLQKKE